MMDYSDLRWWQADSEAEITSRLMEAVSGMEAEDKSRQREILHRVRMYGNRAFRSISGEGYHRTVSSRRGRYNVVKATADIVINRILQQRPKPTPLPMGGNFSIATRARNLDRFLQGQWRVSNVRAHTSRQVRDAIVTGHGVIKIGEDGHQITVERVFASDLSVDPLEARYGCPLTMYQRRYVDREVLKSLYPDATKTIEQASREHGGSDYSLYSEGRDPRADQILVIEAWRLPSGHGAEDGSHVVCVSSGVLSQQPWEHDYFSFVDLAWDPPYAGYWGDSLVDTVAGTQLEINRLVAKIARATDIGGHNLLFIDALTKLKRSEITNDPLAIVKYQGNKPQLQAIEALSASTYQQLESLKQEAYELAGVGQMQAGSQVPRGLDSGRALQVYNDLGSLRFLWFSQRFEAMHVEIARQFIDRARDLAKRNGGDFAVPAERDKYSLARIKWADVDMEADQYHLSVFPTSSLPADPAGRLAYVETMVRAGMISPQRGMFLLDFPDVEAELSLERAATEQIDRHVEMMLDDGRRMQPSPYMDLSLTLKRVQSHLLRGESWEVPDDRLRLLRDYLSMTHALMQRQQAEQQRQAAAAGQATGGMRAPAPGAPPATGVTGVPPTAGPVG